MESDVQGGTMTPPLLGLPSELVQHILAYLPPTDLARVAQVCRRLQVESYTETIWSSEINSHFSSPITKPATINSFRELYITHHPHWFLVKKRIWIGDSVPNGKLTIARYDESTGSIDAYTVLAVKRTNRWTEIDIDQNPVIVHTFDPEISLDLHRPVLKLKIDNLKADPPNEHLLNHNRTPESSFGHEILMETATESGLYSSFMLCCHLPEVAITEGTQVWPPQRIPAECRTRNASHDRFNSSGHRPKRLSQVSQNNFRLRKWVEYRRPSPEVLRSSQTTSSDSRSDATGSTQPFLIPQPNLNSTRVTIRMPEDITTFGTLPEWCYTPTPQKPWQGIWCGDYSGHGCEFILITQPDKEAARPLPRGMAWLQRWFNAGRGGPSAITCAFAAAMEEIGIEPFGEVPSQSGSASEDGLKADEEQKAQIEPSGRLEAIKLTGDLYIPRAEYTFIAPEVGDTGTIRVEGEGPFKGARVVRSAGHIADRGFRDDRYMPTQLILLSHDRIAHYWEEFSSISYLHRVDLNELMRYGRE